MHTALEARAPSGSHSSDGFSPFPAPPPAAPPWAPCPACPAWPAWPPPALPPPAPWPSTQGRPSARTERTWLLELSATRITEPSWDTATPAGRKAPAGQSRAAGQQQPEVSWSRHKTKLVGEPFLSFEICTLGAAEHQGRVARGPSAGAASAAQATQPTRARRAPVGLPLPGLATSSLASMSVVTSPLVMSMALRRKLL